MTKNRYGRISLEDMAKETQVISDSGKLIVSRNPTGTQEYSFDLKHPHIIEGIALVFCMDGKARIKVNLSTYDIQENTVAVFIPNHFVQILEQSDNLRIEFLFFSFDFISDMRITTELGEVVRIVEEQACLSLDKEKFTELLDLRKLILKHFERQLPYKEVLVKHLLYALLYQILQGYLSKQVEKKDKNLSRKEEMYRRFMSLLFEHYKKERSINFYADKMYLTPKYFSKIIKEVSGKSVQDWIEEMVITAAKALLKGTELSVAQIADELNFATPSFFGAYFRKRVGLTPRQYRTG